MQLDTSSPWIDRLTAEVDEWAAVLAAAPPPPAALVDAARDRAAVATLQLDGSPIEEVPPRLESLPIGTETGPARGGWLEVLRSGAEGLEAVPDEVLLAVEHHGARAGLDAIDLGAQLLTDPLPALRTLHRRMTEGLLAPESAGAPRRTVQAVHDSSVGRVLFFPVDTPQVGPRTERLAEWLLTADAHPLVLAGVLHHQVLDIHPFEAANGRLARTAARLVLATAGIDADRVTQPESVLLADSIGYLDEVARSRRYGDPRVFVERWAEAVAEGLRRAATELGVAPDVEVPHDTVAFLAAHQERDFTLLDHRNAVGDDDGLDAARRAGLATRVLGTNGLRWRGPAAD